VFFRFKGAVIGYGHLLPSELPMSPREAAGFIAGTIGRTSVELAGLGLSDVRVRAGKRLESGAGLRTGEDVLDRLDARSPHGGRRHPA
jgi:hypothetical protein